MAEAERAPQFLIADVAALTGVAPPRLRSWERAGLLSPRRSTGAVRIYGIEELARVRLIQRSLVNPGRRGSLRRLVARLATGEVRPEPGDYAEFVDAVGAGTPAPGEAVAGVPWRTVLDALTEPVVVCDADGALVYTNRAFRAAWPSEHVDSEPSHRRDPASANVPAGTLFAAGDLSLRWTARTGAAQRDVPLTLHGADGRERHTRWQVAPLRDAANGLRGAVAVGRDVTADHLLAQVQGDWLAVAAHDLRAPVTSILGNVQLARRSLAAAVRRSDGGSGGATNGSGAAAGEPKRNEIAPLPRLLRQVETAETGIRELLRTMETLLDAAAAAAGELVGQLDPESVDLGVIAERAVEHARALTRRHALTLAPPAVPVTVAGDRARLHQLFDNLLANAVKYAPDGGSIEVHLETAAEAPAASGADPSSGPWALIRVADEGLGIPAADVPRVFDRYYRADGAARLVQGTGLGLYTCRAIAAAHGGHIWIERTAVAPESVATAETSGDEERDAWHGTVVALALPLSSVPTLARSEAVAVGAVVTEEGKGR